jgi:acetylornithine deacetylase/succinyl-diaminopimelate desuccinylase-like protein
MLQQVLNNIDKSKVETVLLNLVKIPGDPGDEAERSAYIKELMEDLDLEVMTQIVEPGRGPNVVGVHRGQGEGKNLMLHAHIDGWPATRDQASIIGGKIEHGKIYGPGVGDQLACIAAFYGVMDAIKRSKIQLKGDLIWAQVIDEEVFMVGSEELGEVGGLNADMVLIGEPTDLNIGHVHTGLVEFEITTKGYAGHPSHILLGYKNANAVLSMHKILNSLLEMPSKEPFFNVTHPKLGKGAVFYVGPIVGGFKSLGDPLRETGPIKGKEGVAYFTPEWCRLRVGVRTFPGQTNTLEVQNLIQKYIDLAKKNDPSIEAEVKNTLNRNYPLEIPESSPAIATLRKAITSVMGKEPKLVGNVYCTDLPPFLKRGMSGAWCGPGYARYLRPDEHVTEEELLNTAKIFTTAALDVCAGVNP